MIVILAPGQGAQSPGFLTPWLVDAAARQRLEVASTAAQLDLIEFGTVADAETIKDTAVAQPLIVAAGIVTAGALADALGTPLADTAGVGGTAGHSVGEFTAATVAGVLTEHDAVSLVAARGRAMAAAAALTPTGMAAVLGGDESALLSQLEELGLTAANRNGGGQIVVAGPIAALEALSANPVAGSRVIPLSVAGAFHTHAMEPAVSALSDAAATVAPVDPRITIWTNHDGTAVDSGARFVELLVGQVASPVRWDLTMASLADAGVTGLIELAPAGTLVGLARRGLKGIPSVAVKTPDDLAAAVSMIQESV